MSKALTALQREGKILLLSFRYEMRNRKTHPAEPARVTFADSQFTFADTDITFAACETEMWEQIHAIVGRDPQQEYDARHIDTAYKNGCACFFTRDKGDILRHRDKLQALLSMRFLHPDDDWTDFVRWMEEEQANRDV